MRLLPFISPSPTGEGRGEALPFISPSPTGEGRGEAFSACKGTAINSNNKIYKFKSGGKKMNLPRNPLAYKD